MADRIHGDFAAANQALARSRNEGKTHALRAELTMAAHLRATRDKHPYTRPITVTKKEKSDA
jgi:hypothetical protein